MVNKAAVGLLGIVVVASLGVGILVGMQLGTTAPADAGQAENEATKPADDGSTSTPADSTSVNTATRGDQRTTVPARQFDGPAIADYVVQFVNQERSERDLQTFSTGGNTAETVRKMAENHSTAMANYGGTVHEVDGVATHERYQSFGLANRCSFTDEDGGFVWDPGKRQFAEDFEALGSTVAGREYQGPNGQQFNGDERAVAKTIVDGWMSDNEMRERILRNGPTLVGVGVEVTKNGVVYVTANVCA